MKTTPAALVRLLSAVALAASAATRGLAAQQPAELAVVFGAVSDQFGQPVSGAEVMVAVPARTLSTRTVAGGAYRLDSIEPGNRQLRIRQLGYLPTTVAADLRVGDMRDHDFTLVKLPAAVDPAIVQLPDGEYRADFTSFAARKARGVGVFLDRAAIDQIRPATATDLMRAVKSFRVLSASGGAFRLVSSTVGGPADCNARVLVDGQPYSAVDGLGDFDPEHIGALEAYAPGEAPAPVDALAGPCGTLIVWLRR